MSLALRQSRCAVFEPPLEGWPAAGVYQLWVRVSADIRLSVGRLGRFAFPAGLYVYTGRASRGLASRVRRHARRVKRKHWHIDYLLARREARIERVTLAAVDPRRECEVNQALADDAGCPASGFGASDCESGCAAHLWRCERLDSPALARFAKRGGQ